MIFPYRKMFFYMYVYNLTVVVSNEIFELWFNWLKTDYIPKVEASKKINNTRIFKVLNTPSDVTFALHHETQHPQDLLDFITKDIPHFQMLSYNLFGEKALMFGTELKEIFL